MALTGSLSLVGLLVLADLDYVAWRTALTGTSSWLDSLVLCPGLHRQHDAQHLAHGEFPACAAMTTGYVFRVENPATVAYLQRVSRTGHLTNLTVHDLRNGPGFALPATRAADTLLQLAAASTIAGMSTLLYIADIWALAYLATLILIRLINIAMIRRQVDIDWHGASEPGVRGDLFILLSYDRWVRIKGDVDDLKAITSGRWLREATALEEALSGVATLLAWGSPMLAATASSRGHIVILGLLVCNAALLFLANVETKGLQMKGKMARVEVRRKYERRRILAEELIEESGRDDWAIAMALIPPKSGGSQYAGGAVL
nr:hypothetical protein B0A51_10078 [Rachicladosporium sp. CCFEE 5018]